MFIYMYIKVHHQIMYINQRGSEGGSHYGDINLYF